MKKLLISFFLAFIMVAYVATANANVSTIDESPQVTQLIKYDAPGGVVAFNNVLSVADGTCIDLTDVVQNLDSKCTKSEVDVSQNYVQYVQSANVSMTKSENDLVTITTDVGQLSFVVMNSTAMEKGVAQRGEVFKHPYLVPVASLSNITATSITTTNTLVACQSITENFIQ